MPLSFFIMSKKYFLVFITAYSPRLVTVKDKTYVEQRGAVYDWRGRLINESQRSCGIHGDLILNKNPIKISKWSRLKITLSSLKNLRFYLNINYSGPHFSQFGHFVTESLTRFSLSKKNFKYTTILHSFDADPSCQKLFSYQNNLLTKLGINIKKIQILVDRPAFAIFCTIEPEKVILNSKIEASANNYWDIILRRTPNSKKNQFPQKIFLSRSKLTSTRLRIPLKLNEEVENMFEENGFTCINPETLDIDSQITLVKNADVIAGFSGSALHLAVFAQPGTKVVEIGDERNSQNPNYHQINICKIRNLEHTFIPYDLKYQELPTLKDEIIAFTNAEQD